jgi:dTDP-4-dehydrorhamnose 3,5-epimerase
MRFAETAVQDAFIVEFDERADERGSFARPFCSKEFAGAGIAMQVRQSNFSRNARRHTLRGLHFQRPPFGEPKVVHCIAGRIFDVAVDLRPASRSFQRWAAVELSPSANRAFYIPSGCAHGFLTLEDNSEIYYLMGADFVPEAGRTLRWDDPQIGVRWPAFPEVISPRDAQAPLLAALTAELVGDG